METHQNKKLPVRTASTVFGIIEQLQEHESLGLTELAAELDMAKSTIHDHVTTLEQLEYLTKDSEEYRLGLKFLELGMTAKQMFPISGIAKEPLDHLANQTGEVSWLVVEEHGYGVPIYNVKSDHGIHVFASTGSRVPLHASASGKAILGNLPQERTREIVQQHGLNQLTPNSIASEEELYSTLETVKEQGYAVAVEESLEGVNAVGAPVIVDGTVEGAISVSGPSKRMTEDRIEDSIVEHVLSVTNVLELQLSSSS